GILEEIKTYYQQVSQRNMERSYNIQIQINSKYITTPFQLGNLFKTYADQDMQNRIKMRPQLEVAINDFYNDFDAELEGEMLNSLVKLYQTKVNRDVASPTLMAQDASNLSLQAHSSIFANKASALNFMLNPDKVKLDADPLYRLSNAYVADQKALAKKFSLVESNFARNNRMLMEGYRKAFPEKTFYPDANGTMRLTYGKVATLPQRADRSYKGITENFYTDMQGLVDKYKEGDEEFDLPKKVLDMHATRDYGIYADAAGYLPVNFLTDHDITGGNSGSPVIDAEGNLIGIAFDGNSEALSGDIVFEPKWQKTINVDIRFVMWTIDQYAGAKRIVDEMTFVTNDHPKPVKGSVLKAKKKR